jgi:hypothetical protein
MTAVYALGILTGFLMFGMLSPHIAAKLMWHRTHCTITCACRELTSLMGRALHAVLLLAASLCGGSLWVMGA